MLKTTLVAILIVVASFLAAAWQRSLCVAWEIIKFLDEHAGAVAGVASLFIASFTFALQRSTRKLWLSSERSSKISTKAWVFAGPHGDSIARDDAGYIVFTVNIVNYGNSPAIIRKICVEVGPAPTSDEPTYRETSETLFELNYPVGIKDPPYIYPREFRMDVDQFVLGYVDYTDAFGDSRRSGFCGRILPHETRRGFFEYIPDGPPAWTYFN